MIHPVDAPLVFAPRRHVPGGGDQGGGGGDGSLGRRTVYSARSTDTGPVPTSPQIRDDHHHRPNATSWSQLYRPGRMPVAEQHKAANDHFDSIDSAMAATVAAAGTVKAQRKSDTLHFPAPVQTPSLEAPLELKSADLNIGANCNAHHTGDYYLTQRAKGPQLVLRRGADFVVNMTFYRAYDPSNDILKLVFEIGDMPTIANLTKIIVPVTTSSEKTTSPWTAVIESAEENRFSLRLNVAANAIVGCWNMKVVSSLKQQPNAGFLDSVSLIHGLYILFNPWAQGDPTYLENDQERDEYILNDSGKIWRGSHNSLRPTYWSFGQFEPGVLEASIYILDRSRLPYPQRASPMQIARLIAQVVNSVDGNGILVGNWTNDFSGGTSPTEWTGSARILRQYAESGQPVIYGQCWVFAGVVTTIMRCLGIPSRVVTNYASAHDSSTTVTIDLHVNNSGKIDRQHTTDSIWAYHVWNECWFSRPDLPRAYWGWQALDATPQEKSDGLYRVGPTSVAALRDGQIGFAYDTAYLFAEVNAEKCYWLMSEENSERLIDVSPSGIGLCISTKRPGRKITGMNNDDRLDISESYKFRSQNALVSKQTILDALLPGHCEQTRIAAAQHANDVEMVWAMNKPVRIGEDFDVAVSISNNSKEERTIKISLRIESMQYFGGEMHKIRSETKAITLPPGGKQEAKMNVSWRDYLSKAMPQHAFMLTSLARVVQTGQIFLSTDDFRVKMPNVTIRAPEKLHAGQPATVVLEFINPLPVMLTHCKFIVDGPGIITSAVVPCRDVSPRGSAKAECQLTPWRSGRDLVLVAHFSSDQLQDIDGATSIDVIAK